MNLFMMIAFLNRQNVIYSQVWKEGMYLMFTVVTEADTTNSKFWTLSDTSPAWDTDAASKWTRYTK